MSTIVLTGGGTAGHCTPNLALIPYLKNNFDNIIYIGSSTGIEKSLVSKSNIPYYEVPCVKLKRSLSLSNLLIPFKLIKGVKESEKILRKINPKIIFSKGGFVSVPVVLAGKKLGIPIISHESDLTIGLSNKLTSKYCRKVLTSFPETAKKLKNGEYVGPPIRSELINAPKKEIALKYFNFPQNKPVILVFGGSQGAKAINTTLYNCLNKLLEKYNIIHICGKGNLNNVNKSGYYQREYMNNIEYAFSACDLCVSRAGSNAIFELLALKVPTLLIPLPKTQSRGDQIVNAEYFTKKGLTHILYQEKLTENSLIKSINKLYSEKDLIKANIEKTPVRDSNRLISNIICNYKR